MTLEKIRSEFKRVELLRKSGDYAQAVNLVRQLLAEPATTEEPELRIQLLIKLSAILRAHLHRPKESLPFLKEAQDIAKRTADSYQLARVYYEETYVNMHLSEYPTAMALIKKAHDLFEQLGNKERIAATLTATGTLCFFTSEYVAAIENLQSAVLLQDELGNRTEKAKALGNIGIAYMELGDYPRALEHFEKSRKLGEETEQKKVCANATGNISLVYLYLMDYPKALEYGQKGLQLLEELNDKLNVAAMYTNIGKIYFNHADYKAALEYFRKARAVYNEMGHRAYVSRADIDIGSVLYELLDYSNALKHYEQALPVFDELGLKTDTAVLHSLFGKLFSTVEFEGFDAQKAGESFHKCLQLSEELGEKKNQYEAHKGLSQFYEQQGKMKEAMEHHKKYHDIYVEVQSEAATKHGQQMENRRKIEESERDRQVKLARFQEQEKILHNILPVQIADRILEGEKQIADYCENVSIFFSDIVGFTKLSQHMPPHELVSMLNLVFTEFDRIARKHGLEKIKTIGDAYMAVAGLPVPQENHAERAAIFALEVMQWMEDYRKRTGNDLHIRTGLHCGHAVAGVIGENKFAYDLWGDAVNTASRMESHGEPGKIQVSNDFRQALIQSSFNFIERGGMEVKGKGMMKTYFLKSKS